MSHWATTRLIGVGYGHSHPWATKANYSGGLMDACSIWHGFSCANDKWSEALPSDPRATLPDASASKNLPTDRYLDHV